MHRIICKLDSGMVVAAKAMVLWWLSGWDPVTSLHGSGNHSCIWWSWNLNTSFCCWYYFLLILVILLAASHCCFVCYRRCAKWPYFVWSLRLHFVYFFPDLITDLLFVFNIWSWNISVDAACWYVVKVF